MFAVFSFTALFFAALVLVGVLKYSQYRQKTISIQPDTVNSMVMISSPSDGSKVRSGSPIIVEAAVINASKTETIGLYLDGEFLGEQPVLSTGGGYFQSEFLIYPSAEGIMILTASMTAPDEGISYSSPVQILVIPPEYDEDATDIVDYDGENDKPGEPETSTPILPGGDLPEADEWIGTIPDWIKSALNDEKPDAPELAAKVEGCIVHLGIQDRSDNEEGFEVWRLLPNSPDWARVEVLAAQSEEEWFVYLDEDAFGPTQYYVAAFNSQGKKNSNLIQVQPDAELCAPAVQERSVEVLRLENVKTEIPVENLYCYVSLDGSSWIRRPESGFWKRESFNGDGTFDLEIISLNLQTDEMREGERSFFLQCWGWLGDELHYLGEFSPVLKPDEPGKRMAAVEGGLEAEVVLNLVPFPFEPVFYPMDDDHVGVGTGDDSVHEIIDFSATTDATMPFLFPVVTYSQEICKNNLPPPFQNELGQILFCFPFPGFDIGTFGANPQPYLVWHASSKCLDGYTDPPCKPYPSWISQAADLGHEVGFYIYDSNPLGFYIHEVNAPELFNFVIPPVPCTGERNFWVRMWYYDGTSLLPTFGPPSDTVTIECPHKVEGFTAFDITFDQLRLFDVEDGDLMGKQDVEAYGYLRAGSGTDTRYINFAPWNQQASSCPDDSVSLTLQSGGGLGCPKIWTEGYYPLSETPLCTSQSYKSCNLNTWNDGNNTIRLVVRESDAMTLSIKLVDWDDASANDVICQGAFTIESQSIFEWKKITTQNFTINTAKTSSGQCRIEGVIRAVED